MDVLHSLWAACGCLSYLGDEMMEYSIGHCPLDPGSREPSPAVSAVPASIPNAGAWCASCNVPSGIGDCGVCRELAWSALMALRNPPEKPAPDHEMLKLALTVGMGAAAEVVRLAWGPKYAQCIHTYIATFDSKPASAIEARSDETGTGSAVGESAVPQAGAQPLSPSPINPSHRGKI